jgi:hypothetical protein
MSAKINVDMVGLQDTPTIRSQSNRMVEFIMDCMPEIIDKFKAFRAELEVCFAFDLTTKPALDLALVLFDNEPLVTECASKGIPLMLPLTRGAACEIFDNLKLNQKIAEDIATRETNGNILLVAIGNLTSVAVI